MREQAHKASILLLIGCVILLGLQIKLAHYVPPTQQTSYVSSQHLAERVSNLLDRPAILSEEEVSAEVPAIPPGISTALLLQHLPAAFDVDRIEAELCGLCTPRLSRSHLLNLPPPSLL